MFTLNQRIHELLLATRKAPCMHCASRATLLERVLTCLQLAEGIPSETMRDFFLRRSGTRGNVVLIPEGDVLPGPGEEWAREVIDEAVHMMESTGL